MSRSEVEALELVERARTLGMSDTEAARWRAEVADPCGCQEGLTAALAATPAAMLLLPGPMWLVAPTGFLVGALLGKAFGIARGMPLVRTRRADLLRRTSLL